MDIFEFVNKCNLGEDAVIIEVAQAKAKLDTSSIAECTDARLFLLEFDRHSKPEESDDIDDDEPEQVVDLDSFCMSNNIKRASFIWIYGHESLALAHASGILANTEYVYVKFAKTRTESDELLACLPGEWMVRINLPDSVLLENTTFRNGLITESGAWTDKNMNEHAFDDKLAYSILNILQHLGVNTCVDFGCGPGMYVSYLKSNGIQTVGYDGNPNTPEITNGACEIINLAEPFDLGKKYDCVLSLEVGEHIPMEFETAFVNNIVRHATKVVALSWAIPGQGGYGHVNCRSNEYIRDLMQSHGFTSLPYIDNIIRSSAEQTWFTNTFMIFTKTK